MTVLETVLGEITLFVERPHIACCLVDTFFCGRSFHPELLATVDDQEEDCCKTCVDIRYEMLCPPTNPRHSHCPLMLTRVCRGSSS
jgi:hypothetical protein